MSATRRRAGAYRRTVRDLSYMEARSDRAAEIAATLYHGLVARGVPEPRAAWIVAEWVIRS